MGFAKVLNIVVLVGLVISWIVMLAGIAKTADTCQDSDSGISDLNDFFKDADRRMRMSYRRMLLDKAVEACGMYYALFWWIVFLQLFTLIGMILLGFGKLASFKGVVAAFCYIVTPLMCYMAHDQVYTAYRLKDADSDWRTSARVFAAGTVASLLFQFLWIIINCSEDPRLQVAPESK